MKKLRLIAAVCSVLLMGVSGNAQDYKNAIGIRLSNKDAAVNNAVTFKHFFDNRTAVEALFSFSDPVAIGALLEKHNDLSTQGLSWFYGAGAYIGFSGRRNLGAQGIVGLEFKFPTAPFNISVDWKPELNLIDDFSFEPAAVGLSARFTF